MQEGRGPITARTQTDQRARSQANRLRGEEDSARQSPSWATPPARGAGGRRTAKQDTAQLPTVRKRAELMLRTHNGIFDSGKKERAQLRAAI